MPPKQSPAQTEEAAALGTGTPGKAGRCAGKASSKMVQDDPFDLIDALLTKKARGGSPKAKSAADTPPKDVNDSDDEKTRISLNSSAEKVGGGAVKITSVKRKAPAGIDSPRKKKHVSALDSAKK